MRCGILQWKKEVKKLVIVHSVSAVHFMHWKWNNSKGNIVGQDKIGFQYLFTERQKKKNKNPLSILAI